MRAGIQSIPRGQVYSAYALGLTYGQAMRLVILPQAFRNMIPVLLTQTIILFQDTSLVYVISATDLSARRRRSHSAIRGWSRCICSWRSCTSFCATRCRIWSNCCRKELQSSAKEPSKQWR